MGTYGLLIGLMPSSRVIHCSLFILCLSSRRQILDGINNYFVLYIKLIEYRAFFRAPYSITVVYCICALSHVCHHHKCIYIDTYIILISTYWYAPVLSALLTTTNSICIFDLKQFFKLDGLDGRNILETNCELYGVEFLRVGGISSSNIWQHLTLAL